MQLPQRATAVVSPMIWFREVKNSVRVAIRAAETIANAERRKNCPPKSVLRYKSISMTTVPERVTTMNVRKPAECRLLDLSQPMSEERSTETQILKITENSLRLADQEPSNVAIGSVIIIFSINNHELHELHELKFKK